MLSPRRMGESTLVGDERCAFHTHTLSNEGKPSLFHRSFLWRGTEASVSADHACSLLVEGKIKVLVEEIVILPPVPSKPGTSRSVPEIERDYFMSNAARMRYPAFRSQSMHIGSGIAKAACKTVVSTSAKREGVRWTKDFHPVV